MSKNPLDVKRAKQKIMKLVTPRQFCRIYFKIDKLPKDQIEIIEESHGYKKRCAAALASVLKMSSLTLINTRYSKGIDFEGLSDQSRVLLTLWVIEKRYQEKIRGLENHVRNLESQLQSRMATAVY